MKGNWKNRLYILIPLCLLLFTDCKQKELQTLDHTHAEIEYTCPMHPQVMQKEPGVCPVCGMDLVKVKSNSAVTIDEKGMDDLTNPSNSVTISSIETITPVNKTLSTSFSANGVITYD